MHRQLIDNDSCTSIIRNSVSLGVFPLHALAFEDITSTGHDDIFNGRELYKTMQLPVHRTTDALSMLDYMITGRFFMLSAVAISIFDLPL